MYLYSPPCGCLFPAVTLFSSHMSVFIVMSIKDHLNMVDVWNGTCQWIVIVSLKLQKVPCQKSCTVMLWGIGQIWTIANTYMQLWISPEFCGCGWLCWFLKFYRCVDVDVDGFGGFLTGKLILLNLFFASLCCHFCPLRFSCKQSATTLLKASGTDWPHQ